MKIESLVAVEKGNAAEKLNVEDRESSSYKNTCEKFRRLFQLGADEKLVRGISLLTVAREASFLTFSR